MKYIFNTCHFLPYSLRAVILSKIFDRLVLEYLLSFTDLVDSRIIWLANDIAFTCKHNVYSGTNTAFKNYFKKLFLSIFIFSDMNVSLQENFVIDNIVLDRIL